MDLQYYRFGIRKHEYKYHPYLQSLVGKFLWNQENIRIYLYKRIPRLGKQPTSE